VRKESVRGRGGRRWRGRGEIGVEERSGMGEEEAKGEEEMQECEEESEVVVSFCFSCFFVLSL
jgi:hypothetical protein